AIIGAGLAADQPFGPWLAQHAAQLSQAVMGESRCAMSSVAAGSAEAYLLALEQHHVDTGTGKFEGGGQAGQSTAHHADIRSHLTPEWRQLRCRLRGSIPSRSLEGGKPCHPSPTLDRNAHRMRRAAHRR